MLRINVHEYVGLINVSIIIIDYVAVLRSLGSDCFFTTKYTCSVWSSIDKSTFQDFLVRPTQDSRRAVLIGFEQDQCFIIHIL